MGINHSLKTGVLLMAYGSPESLDDMEAYLLDVRGGRPTSQELVQEIKERYALIGGHSPLLELTRAQAQALQTELDKYVPGAFQTYVGMRHWEPRIREALSQMGADGIQQAVAIVMAPHSSRLSSGAYFARLDEALNDLGLSIPFARVPNWHDHPGLIAALAKNASVAMQRFAPRTPYIVFTAHSLPVSILESGDPYVNQLLETAELVARKLGLSSDQWRFSFQSAGKSTQPWLGPPIEETLESLAQDGQREVLVVPVGFMCDHVEILYDLDIVAQEQAYRLGLHLERSASLNDNPQLIAALADIALAYSQRLPNPIHLRDAHAHPLSRT